MSGRIVVHKGSAHMDDFLSVCLVLAKHEEVHLVERRDPIEEDLEDPSVWVLDVGHRYEVEKRNFDHHQFPPGTRDCAFSLLVKHFGLAQDLDNSGWYKALVAMDALGPAVAAEDLGCSTEVLSALFSPLERWFLQEFGDQVRHEKGDELFGIFRRMGNFILSSIERDREGLSQLQEKAQWAEVKGYSVLLFLEENVGIGTSLKRYQEICGRQADVLVTWNKRNGAWGFNRMDDEGPFDFRRICKDPAVKFVHASGFMATTVEKVGVPEILRLVEAALA